MHDEQILQLAKMLEAEFRGGPIDRRHARELAESLLPVVPELRSTLTSVRERMRRG